MTCAKAMPHEFSEKFKDQNSNLYQFFENSDFEFVEFAFVVRAKIYTQVTAELSIIGNVFENTFFVIPKMNSLLWASSFSVSTRLISFQKLTF